MKLRNFLAVLLLIVLCSQAPPPKYKYDWEDSFYTKSSQPFGCLMMDSLLQSSMPNGYQVVDANVFYHPFNPWKYVDKTYADSVKVYTLMPDLILRDSVQKEHDAQESEQLFATKRSYIVYMYAPYGAYFETVNDAIYLPQEWSIGCEYYLLDLVKRGNNVMILRMGGQYDKFLYSYHESQVLYNSRNEVVWHGANDKTIVKTYGCLLGGTSLHAEDFTPLITDNSGYIYAAMKKMGKGVNGKGGKLIVCTSPRMFTNYGFLWSNGNRKLAMRLLSQMQELPMVRVNYISEYTDTLPHAGTWEPAPQSAPQSSQTDTPAYENTSPIALVLQHEPLKWAMWVAIAGVVLLCFFTARRRQRIIPATTSRDNQHVSFLQHLGAMLYSHHHHHQAVAMQLEQLREMVSTTLMVDLVSPTGELDDKAVATLATAVHSDRNELRHKLQHWQEMATGEKRYWRRQIVDALEQINTLIESL